MIGAIADHYVAESAPPVSAYAAAVLADSPLGYWRMGDQGAAVAASTASTSFSGEAAGRAFDGNNGTSWTTNGTSSGWIRAQLATAVPLTNYRIGRRDDIPARNPKDWTFEGSNDGTTWTVLDTQTGITWPTAGETKAFDFANTTAYLYYRLNVTANNGDTYLSIAELGLSPLLTDSSGNSRRGTLIGSPTLGVAGLISGDTDTCMEFNGSTQWARVPHGSWMSPSLVTLEAVIRPDSVSSKGILDRDHTSGRNFQFRLNAGKLELLMWTTVSGLKTAVGSTTLVAGTTYHVAGRFNGSALQVFVNGVSNGTIAASGAMAAGSSDLIIGALQAGAASAGTWPFDGKLDEVAYYGTALSDARIAAHAAAV